MSAAAVTHDTRKPRNATALLALALLVLVAGVTPVLADDLRESQKLVTDAAYTVEAFGTDANMQAFRDMAQKARGMLVVPQLVRAGFIIGGSGGTGALVVRDDKGTWSQPAFYTVGGASFGFQAGVESSEVVMLCMTERGVNSLLSNQVKLGGDVSVALGPVGAGIKGETAGLSADIVTFSRSKGLYGGVSLEGAVVAVRGKLNDAYYGKKAGPADILIRRTVSNPHSADLDKAVAKAAGGM
jgi:lipid-binding SYLF domain-containing protein